MSWGHATSFLKFDFKDCAPASSCHVSRNGFQVFTHQLTISWYKASLGSQSILDGQTSHRDGGGLLWRRHMVLRQVLAARRANHDKISWLSRDNQQPT